MAVALPSPALLAKAARIRSQLHALYPPPFQPMLQHKNKFELLCAVLLSAQTTDKSVNACTPACALPRLLCALPPAHAPRCGLLT